MADMMKRIIPILIGLCFALCLHAATVNLYFFSDGKKIHTEEVDADTDVTLSSVLSSSTMNSTYACRGYEFYGWKEGSPITSDEDPSVVCTSTVHPEGAMILHAVWRNTTGSTSFVRITSTDDLHAGDKYLIVCHYMYGGYNQYYAMSNVSGKYTYNNREYYKLDAFRLYPTGGVINAPDNYLIWTLDTYSGDWVWRPSAEPTKSLYVGNNASYAMLDTDPNRCTVSESNGVFSIKHYSNNRYLSYVSDEITETDDYFITATSPDSDYPIYLYKQASAYTSYPGCSAWTVHLNAGDGTFPGPADLTEDPAGSGVTLPTASISCGGDVIWEFAGWHSETPLEGTTTSPTLHNAGAYDPTFNGEKLYAVYKNKIKYTKVTTTPLTAGDYIIVAESGGNYYALGNVQASAVTYNGNTCYPVTPISVALNEAGEIEGEQASSIEWTYGSSKFRNKANGTYISPITRSDIRYIIGQSDYSNLSLLKNSEHKWAIYNSSYNNNNLTYNNGKFINTYTGGPYYHFYLYKKSAASVTYTSTPHCTPYSVKLHGCGGVIQAGSKTKTDTIYWETSAGGGIILPSANPICTTGNWEFVGWFVGEDLPSTKEAEFTDFKAQGSTYVPAVDGEELYAIYKRKIDRYRILYSPSEMVANDDYLIAAYASSGDEYGNLYMYLMSSTKSTAAGHTSCLSAERYATYQDAGGYYIEGRADNDPPENAIHNELKWTLGGSAASWTFTNMETNKLYINGADITTDPSNATLFTVSIVSSGGGFYFTIQKTGGNYITYTVADNYFSASSGISMFLFRQMREYTSWPHCAGFTVFFEECGGTAGEEEVQEQNAYDGIILPKAYAPSDCSKEGWVFAGWATTPYDEESGALLTDLLPADVIYHPLSDSITLYAVYCDKTNTYKKINSLLEMKLGVNYILAVGTHAMGNLPYNTNYIESVDVTPTNNVITIDNPAVEWRLQGVGGEYVWYNPARGTTGRYLDLRTPGSALMTTTIEDNFRIECESGIFIVHSNKSQVSYTDRKYLGNSGSSPYYFNTVTDENLPTLYLYQQQATYWSYPNCVEPVDVVKWEKNNDGSFMYLESFTLKGELIVTGSLSTTRQTDGTYRVQYNPSVLTECSQADIMWGEQSAKINIPYIVSTNNDLTTLLGGRADCSTCDIYVMPNTTLTVNSDETLHTVTVPEDATLSFDDTTPLTLTVNSLVLGAEGDKNAPAVNLNTNGSIILKNDELYYDLRIPNDRYYWLTLPYNSQLQEISYSNVATNGGTPPKYYTDYYLYFYDGARRADDANAGVQHYPYWTPVVAPDHDYTMQRGQGYLLGIDDALVGEFNSQGYVHTKRVLRFTMRPEESTWLNEERTSGGSKTTTIVPSTCVLYLNQVHAGWNLIGNPYMHTYTTTSVTGESGLRNGAWTEQLDEYGDETGYWVLDETDPTERPTDVPYFTIYNLASNNYSQELVTTYGSLRPFEAVFVQINSGNTINFVSEMNVTSAPRYLRTAKEDAPVRSGISLSGVGYKDRTGIVLADEYTTHYEVGADLEKWSNNGVLNLYTINSDNHKLAFNGLSEENAINPIPVGVTFPIGGEYTFTFDEDQYDVNVIDTLMIIDKSTGKSQNLKYSNYTFTAEEGTNNDRFEILIRLAKTQQIATDMDNIYDTDKPRKVIMNGQLFILRDDEIYNAMGTKVK